MTFRVCILLRYVWTLSCLLAGERGHGQKHHWTNVSKYLDDVCRFHDVCRLDTNNLYRVDYHCCRPCSCKPDCGLTQNCCYPELDRYKLVDRSHQLCFVPVLSANVTNKTLKDTTDTAYNMVVDAYPLKECVKTSGIVGNCGNDETASPFGSLYPVYSPKTGRIYKNINCAKCHGLHKEDVVAWSIDIGCFVENNSSLRLDINTFIEMLPYGKFPPACRIKFVYPGPETDLLNEKCFNNAIQSCLPDFKVPKSLDMTKDEVIADCQSDLHSPYVYLRVYANVFCYLCSSIDPISYIKYRCQSDEGRTTLGLYSFITVLSPDSFKRISTDRLGNTVTKDPLPSACRKTKIGKDCRPLFCPTGQVTISKTKCAFATGETKVDALMVALMLRPTLNISSSKMDELVNKSTLAGENGIVTSPWRSVSKYQSFYYKVNNDTDTVEYILRFVPFQTNSSFKLEDLVNNVTDVLPKSWFIQFPDGLVKFEQEFSFTGNVELIDKGIALKEAHTEEYNKTIISNVPFPKLNYVKHIIRGYWMTINKLYFCKQISLNTDEYQLFKDIGILYYKPLKRIFYDNEFSMVFDLSLSDYIPRLCVNDTEFTIVRSISASNNKIHCMYSLLLKFWSIVVFQRVALSLFVPNIPPN